MDHIITIYLQDGKALTFHQASTLEILLDQEIRFDYLMDDHVHHAKFFISQISGYVMSQYRYTDDK